MIANRARLLIPALLACGTIAACGGSSGGGGRIAPPPPPPPPQNIEIALTPVFTQLNLVAPVALLQAPGDDSRWYVVQQAGQVITFENQPGVAVASQFADLAGRVDSGASEAGLLGMAFHPDFSANGEVFLSYTTHAAPVFDSIVSRFVVDPGGMTLDAGSEEILLRLPQPETNHNGGHLAFGPDGLLYAGFGDGGGANDPNERAQNTRDLYGTIVRIDVDGNAPYGIPPGNPFGMNTNCAQGSGTAACPEIFAWGLRNPWRFSFDRQTGELWAGDVGQGAWEEIDRILVGENYGWPIREGAHCFRPASGCGTSFEEPVTEYDHSVGRSVTGGYVYRGSSLPGLVGTYLFGDFISGVILSVPSASPLGTAAEERLDTPLNIVSFAEDASGELYVLDYNGTIHRVVEAP